jgi:hypothetical protein
MKIRTSNVMGKGLSLSHIECYGISQGSCSAEPIVMEHWTSEYPLCDIGYNYPCYAEGAYAKWNGVAIYSARRGQRAGCRHRATCDLRLHESIFLRHDARHLARALRSVFPKRQLLDSQLSNGTTERNLCKAKRGNSEIWSGWGA